MPPTWPAAATAKAAHAWEAAGTAFLWHRHTTLETVFAVLIIYCALVFVRKHFKGLAHVLELLFGLCFVILVTVRVPLQSRLLVCYTSVAFTYLF